MSRAERRKNNWRKAKRKAWIVHHVYCWPDGWYNNLHQYSKGKVHCSCPLCAAKTNRKRKRIGHGYIGKDLRRVLEMEYEERELQRNEDDDGH